MDRDGHAMASHPAVIAGSRHAAVQSGRTASAARAAVRSRARSWSPPARRRSALRRAVAGRGGYRGRMCRNIRTLHNFEPPATGSEVHAAALQYVRKVSGAAAPSQANSEAFDEAVAAVAHATQHLLDGAGHHRAAEEPRGRGGQGARPRRGPLRLTPPPGRCRPLHQRARFADRVGTAPASLTLRGARRLCEVAPRRRLRRAHVVRRAHTRSTWSPPPLDVDTSSAPSGAVRTARSRP